MAAATFLTWDGLSGASPEVPRRPSTDDMGGDDLIDDTENPPGTDMPTAGGWNQKVDQIAALARVVSPCKISIRFSIGVPYVYKFATAASSAAITISTFTVTDNGTGDTSITWPANTFPPHEVEPHSLTITEDVEIDRARIYSITNGVRIKTKLGATATNANFTFGLG